jgi:hypothetical protein
MCILYRASSIFNAKDIAPKKKDSGRVGGREADDNMSDVNDSDKSDFEILTKAEERNRELVDLTKEQVQKGTGDISALDEMDDFDLLDASIDPTDIKSMERVAKLQQEIAYEKAFISCKAAYKYSMTSEDPWQIYE